jgi:hypothetical protein
VKPGAIRLARVHLQVGKASWKVCESCSHLLVRERRNWGRAGLPVKKKPFDQPKPLPVPAAKPRIPMPKRVPVSKRLLKEQRARLRAEKEQRARLRAEKAPLDRMAERHRRKTEWLKKQRRADMVAREESE